MGTYREQHARFNRCHRSWRAGVGPSPNVELWEKGRDYQARLVQAPRSGDPETARKVMAEHMKTAQSLMEGLEAAAFHVGVGLQGIRAS